MAVLNQIGEVSLNQILVRRLTTPGGTTAPGVAPELFPCIVLESDRPEWKYLGNEMLGSVTSTQAAGAVGQYAQVELVNPANSGKLVIVESARWLCSGSQSILGVRDGGTIVAGTPVSPVSRDTRNITAVAIQRPVAQVNQGTTIAPALQNVVRFTAGLEVNFGQPIILRPNSALHLWAVVDATSLGPYSFHWRERQAEPSELR